MEVFMIQCTSVLDAMKTTNQSYNLFSRTTPVKPMPDTIEKPEIV